MSDSSNSTSSVSSATFEKTRNRLVDNLPALEKLAAANSDLILLVEVVQEAIEGLTTIVDSDTTLLCSCLKGLEPSDKCTQHGPVIREVKMNRKAYESAKDALERPYRVDFMQAALNALILKRQHGEVLHPDLRKDLVLTAREIADAAVSALLGVIKRDSPAPEDAEFLADVDEALGNRPF